MNQFLSLQMPDDDHDYDNDDPEEQKELINSGKFSSSIPVVLNLLVMRDHLTKFLSCHGPPTVWR
jgi:hypothetical protein